MCAPGRQTDRGIRPRWFDLTGGKPALEVLPTDDGRSHAVLERLWRMPKGEGRFVTVVVPEEFRRPSLVDAINRTSFRLKLKLHTEPGVVVADVPHVAAVGEQAPTRLVCRVLVANVHAGSLRAVNYARSLHIEDVRTVSFAFDDEEARALTRAWERLGAPLPLDLSDAPHRDIGTPILAYLRELTADPDVVVNVVMPEIVVRAWRRSLHNQRALYMKRLLLFEPRVILTSVPYQLF